MTNTEEHFAMVEDCENRESKLSDWERGFVDSLRSQLEKDRKLTEKQEITLDAIWDRVT